jgi:hypothetical protein
MWSDVIMLLNHMISIEIAQGAGQKFRSAENSHGGALFLNRLCCNGRTSVQGSRRV